MKERIKKFIDYKGISAGELADLLDVQRSNISHILNGRNKPGAIFIERFLLTFTEVNARWLLTGKGSMTDNHSRENSGDSDNSPKEENTGLFKTEPSLESASPKTPDVDKVILLYANGTFRSYNSH